MKGLIIVCMLFGLDAYGQYLTPERTYSRADTLRGTLNSHRSCYDVTFYDLTVKVDIPNKSIAGNNKIYFTATQDFELMQIDLFSELAIEKILCNGAELKYKREYNAVFITMDKKLTAGQTSMIHIFYAGNPRIAVNPPWDGGLTFTRDEMERDWIGVSCEGLGASVWWPNKDHLSDEPDSMMIRGIVREDLLCVSNGNLRKVYDAEDGFKQYDWFVSYPINNYNVSINIGNYVHFGDTYINPDGEKLALEYYVMDYNLDKAKVHFEQVKPMMRCFEEYMGKYPFYRDGYKLIEAPYLGMEHQSGIAYGNKYLAGYMGYDYSGIGATWDYIIIHESGHEWWGNSVSAKDIADLWIHEGICSYSEVIYMECLYGYDEAMRYAYHRYQGINNKRPMIGDYDVNNEGDDIYNKGLALMNTLRHVIHNDALWWNIIRGIQKDFAYQTVTSKQIENYISERSGYDLSKIFDQYLRYTKPPLLKYTIVQVGSDLKLTYVWQADVKDFFMPIKVTKAKDKFDFIVPTSKEQSIVIKDMVTGDFKLDLYGFYYLVNEPGTLLNE
ncbi:MAG: M1 family metallopeptidase [Chitinophagales bacterium]|nr:M1 family metallopeptidase [Chitinophagales bacterium]